MSEQTDVLLSALRPVVLTEPAEYVAEQFQNQTLRPILKLQNETLIRAFRQYAAARKNAFFKFTEPDKRIYITSALRQDVKLHSLLKGMIIGHFTEVEWQQYTDNEEEINKRLSSLLLHRLLSNIAAY